MVAVNGSVENIQTGVDFYLKVISSKTKGKPDKSIRETFFKIFEAEDEKRKDKFLFYREKVSLNYAINRKRKPILDGDEVVYTPNGGFVFRFDVDEGDSLNATSVVEEMKHGLISVSDVFSEISSNDTLEEPNDDEMYNSDILKVITSSIGVFDNSDEDDFVGVSYIEDGEESSVWEDASSEFLESDIEEDGDDSFSNWGNDEEQEADSSKEDLEEDEFINWGKEDEGEESEATYIANSEDSTTEDEEDEFINWGKEDEDIEVSFTVDSNDSPDSEESDSVISSTTVEEDLSDEDTFESWGSEEDITDIEEVIPIEKEIEPSTLKEDKSISEKTSSKVVPVWSGFDGVDDSQDEDFLGEFGGFSNVETVQNTVLDVVKEEEPVIEVPKDIRDFVKLHPNCEISFAMQYFSRKDIDKQLSLGRIYKRKNKLLI